MEEWRPAPDFEELYEVSSLGRVRRIGGHVLKPRIPKNGYDHVDLWRNNRGKTFRLNRLVAVVFLGPCPPGHEVNHVDTNKRNNAASNLEYATRMENIRHAWNNHLYPYGERHHQARLTEDAVREMRRLYGQPGVTLRQLGERYGVGDVTVLHAVRRDTWRHVP